jgi:hypothetical protein
VFDDKTISFLRAEVISKNFISGVKIINWKDDLIIKLDFELLNLEINKLSCAIIIVDKEQRPIAAIRKDENIKISNKTNYQLTFNVKDIQLSKGAYSINVVFYRDNSPSYRANDVSSFQVSHKQLTWEPFMLDAKLEIN